MDLFYGEITGGIQYLSELGTLSYEYIMPQDDAKPPKHIDIRTRFEDNDAKVMFELKKYYNLTSWPAVIRFALAAAHREMIEKKE